MLLSVKRDLFHTFETLFSETITLYQKLLFSKILLSFLVLFCLFQTSLVESQIIKYFERKLTFTKATIDLNGTTGNNSRNDNFCIVVFDCCTEEDIVFVNCHNVELFTRSLFNEAYYLFRQNYTTESKK